MSYIKYFNLLRLLLNCSLRRYFFLTWAKFYFINGGEIIYQTKRSNRSLSWKIHSFLILSSFTSLEFVDRSANAGGRVEFGILIARGKTRVKIEILESNSQGDENRKSWWGPPWTKASLYTTSIFISRTSKMLRFFCIF
jgi:hypothetical protein